MTAGSDNTDQPSDSEKAAPPEPPKAGKSGMTDGSSVQSQTSTGARPFMIYPIPKAGKSDPAAETPEGRPYEEVLAINSPVRPSAAPSIAADNAKPAEESPAVPLADAQVPASGVRRKRVSKTLLDYAVPEADKLASNQPATSPTYASTAADDDAAAAASSSAAAASPPQSGTMSVVTPEQSLVAENVSVPASPPMLKAPSTPVVKTQGNISSANDDDDTETSASVLHRIANSQAINHKKKEQKVLLPPVPPPMRRKKGVARTMLDMFVNIGNQLTGSGQTPEPPLVDDSHQLSESTQTSRNVFPEAPVAANYESAAEAPAQEAPHNAVSENSYVASSYEPVIEGGGVSDYQQPQGEFQPEQNEQQQQQYYYESTEGAGATQESRGDRIPRTLLDHSVLFDTVSRSSEKQILKAVEEQKEKLNEPFVPFIPVEAEKLAKDCPWKWEGEEGKERVRYCDRCQHQVYNFSGLERPEADALVFKRENREPKTLYKRTDGKFMTSDCPLATKKQREMVLAVVGGIFLLTIVFGCMMLVPHPVPPPTTTVNSNSDAHSDQPHILVTRTSSHSDSAATPSSSSNSTNTSNSGGGGMVGTPSGPPPVIPSGSGSNGGYGPSSIPPGTPVSDDWQWQYNNNNAQSNPPQAQAIISRPPASTPPVDPAKAEEIQRLKNEIDETNGSH